MKRNFFRKALSLLLALTMLVPLVSPAFAFRETEESALQANASMALGSGNGVGMWAGDKLAGGVAGAIFGYGMNKAMGEVFGTDTNKILQSLEAVKAGIRDIKNDIANLSSKIDQQDLKKSLNDYGEFINKYVGMYNNLSTSQIKYANDPALTKLFLQDIYSAEDQNYLVDGVSLINATLNLGGELTRVHSDAYNIFGAIDLLDKFIHVWEHQGYDMREKFRINNLNIYMMYSSMSQLACKMVIESNDESEYNKSKAEVWEKQLRDDADKVNNMVKRTSVVQKDKTINVIRHPDLRIARNIKQGQDLCAFYPDIKIGYVTKDRWGDEVRWADFSRSGDKYSLPGYIYTMTHDETAKRTAWSQGWEVYTNQPTPAEYKILRDNYDGQQSLYNIFFDKDKGNFNNVENKPAGLAFLCNHYVSRNCRDGWINWESNNHVGNNGEVYGWWKFSAARFNKDYTGSARDNWFDHGGGFSVNRYLGEVKQGLLQGPPPQLGIVYEDLIMDMDFEYELPYAGIITLTVNKNDDEYQWLVNKNDDKGFVGLDGATAKTYTLPELVGSMNGWQYSCTTTELHDPTQLPPDPADPAQKPIIQDNNVYTYAVPVTLNLTGDGVAAPVTVHEIGDATALKDALNKVDSGEWDRDTLKLTANITYPNSISMEGMRNLTLDLNGYTLTVQPDFDAEPNVNAISSKPQIAAICLKEDQLTIKDSSEVLGVLNIVAGPGIDYGIYAANKSEFDGYDGVSEEAVTVTSSGGGTAIHATDDSFVGVKGSVQAEGEDAYGIECINSGSAVIVDKNVTVSGKSACGVYVASFDGGNSTQIVRILSGSLTVSGENSRAAFLDANAEFSVGGNVTVTGGREGISVNNGYAEITGDITAPDYAINAWSNNARVLVGKNVSVTRKNALAMSSVGAEIRVGGNVTSSNSGGVGILAATWMSPGEGSLRGALVTANGKIAAVTPLLIEGVPVTDESKITSTSNGYNVFTIPEKGSSVVNAMPDAFFEYKSGSDGGSSIPVTPTVPAANGSVQVNYAASKGTASLSLSTVKVNEIIEKSKSNEAVLDLSKISGITAVSIPKDALTAFAKAGLDTTVKLPVGTITLDKEATASVAQQSSGGNLAVELKQAVSGTLTVAQKEIVKSGDIVLDINITSGIKKISTFVGTLTVWMPYIGMQPVAVWYLNDKGDLEKLSCTFKNGVVSFNLDHLSLYVVGQDTAKPTWVNPFIDVKEADWFYAAVSFCAEKGITNGTSATTFNANATLTRGQFITMLLKAYGIEAVTNYDKNFADAGNTYYTDYLAVAKAKDISKGVGNNKFAPEQAITRQEMFTLLYNALKVLNKLTGKDTGKTFADFTDSGDVATWAAEAITALVKSGTVSGIDDKLDPTGVSTRAQMAQVLYNLLGK